MKIQQFLEHHGIVTNPFAEEDAQTDPVFRDHCIRSTYHPTWDKIFGNPAQPSTSIVFGEKGAGKTALRLQMAGRLADFNRDHPNERVYVIEYDDFNPFLDRFAETLSARKRKPARALAEWKLWDHMDAILSLAVTGLVDRILSDSSEAAATIDPDLVAAMGRHQKRDLLLLAACYDQSTAETFKGRWHRLRRKLKFRTWKSLWDRAAGVAVLLVVAAAVIMSGNWSWLASPWPYVFAILGWVPWAVRAWKWFWQARGVARNVRVGNHETRPLRQVLMHFAGPDISGQPLPNKQRTDDRYELLAKFQGLLRTLGYAGIIVLVDRLDEPHLINGSADQMKALLWPMLDNKFLKLPGIGFKLLLPIELTPFIDREQREFYERARLDKQNMVPSLEWTAESLYDVANARLQACAADGSLPTLRDLFEDSVSDQRLHEALRSLRVPRHLFKFLYRVFVAHASAHTDDRPAWKISAETFESTLALYSRDQDAVDRGLRAG
ncbi:MAG: hypothetical protein KDA42_15435 [Planctomycetales bacterium]|nr:hypothetical protein [Planctomycetales bacterium]